ncbi:hypothetical protein FIBSPDRAFT_548609 [Athelia psychrophila]|uniref:Uncharacterized protein n=1 Tax=Athelia psychrophila TaxID=1759441 RepID=A0A166UQV0_9AGAM|nr:hypothetical protein FIBSPDRAFT_548609 [Fibularhizoctonia sp. CBS 109695]
MQAQNPDNLALVAELRTRNAEIEKKIGVVGVQLQMLKIPFTKKIRNFFLGHNDPRFWYPASTLLLHAFRSILDLLFPRVRGSGSTGGGGFLHVLLYLSSFLSRIRFIRCVMSSPYYEAWGCTKVIDM